MKRVLKILVPVLLILAVLAVAGCSKQTSVSMPSYEGAQVPTSAPPPAPSVLQSKGAAYDSSSRLLSGEAGGGEIDRKIVKNGYMTMEVNDIVAAINDITSLAKGLNGYVVSSSQQGYPDVTYGQISIRVPSDTFDEALNQLRKLAVNVPSENTNSQDVTQEYTDLQAQLRNLEATEAQYLQILQKAEKVEDILAVQRELSNVRGQIEQIKGRILYIERTSDMALIDVSLQKVKPIGGTAWSALETLKSAARGLVSFGKALADILIYLVIFSPVWIIILVVVLYFVKWRPARKAKVSKK